MVWYKGKFYPRIRYVEGLFSRFTLRIINQKKNRIKQEAFKKIIKLIQRQRRKTALENEIKNSKKILYEFYTRADYYFRMD